MQHRSVPVDDGIVIFNPTTRAFVDLNESAAEMWATLTASRWSAEAVAAHLVATYEMPAADARATVEAFVADLAANGIVIAPSG